jgi:hypothetical protein
MDGWNTRPSATILVARLAAGKGDDELVRFTFARGEYASRLLAWAGWPAALISGLPTNRV